MIEDYGQWYEYILAFTCMIHTKYGYMVHYPFEGGFYDQPYRMMQIFRILQDEYRQLLKEKAQK